MWEDNRGSSLRLGNTAVPDPLLPIIILLQGGKKEMACTDTSSGEGDWDEVTTRLLLYSLHSVGILFTPELLCFRFCWKCAVQSLLIHAASGFINATSTAEMMTPSNIPVHKPYFYYMVLIISLVAVALSDCCDRGCLFVNRWKQHLAPSLSRPVQKGGLELVKKKAWAKRITYKTIKKTWKAFD